MVFLFSLFERVSFSFSLSLYLAFLTSVLIKKGLYSLSVCVCLGDVDSVAESIVYGGDVNSRWKSQVCLFCLFCVRSQFTTHMLSIDTDYQNSEY